jgi:hypothetical protein
MPPSAKSSTPTTPVLGTGRTLRPSMPIICISIGALAQSGMNAYSLSTTPLPTGATGNTSQASAPILVARGEYFDCVK